MYRRKKIRANVRSERFTATIRIQSSLIQISIQLPFSKVFFQRRNFPQSFGMIKHEKFVQVSTFFFSGDLLQSFLDLLQGTVLAIAAELKSHSMD